MHIPIGAACCSGKRECVEGLRCCQKEAMASGVPVVAPDDASFPELIGQTGAGALCGKGSTTALADTLGQLLLDRGRLANCAAAGRQAAAQTYNIERMAESFAARLAKLA